ncbi:CTP synthase [Candidatus Saccharibacteria bacterium]|jgi:CTP synthase|nr:CTP synthase [Candidatus Saccharibacteria bacterium]
MSREKDARKRNRKYIFVTGGVLSGVGKGIAAAAMGAVLKSKGSKVSVQKCDPYLNVDAGLLNPVEHGECFVTKDGAETDLDLGHYERFLDIELTREASTLSGRLLLKLIEDERAGKFDGRTVQLVPHLTGAIQDEIEKSGADSDVHFVEIGGTVGDYESLSFIEAIREFSNRVGCENCLYVHVVYVPYIKTSNEFKTKPAQNALNDLRGFGITPDCVIVRTDEPAPESVGDKLAMFGGLKRSHVIMLPNASTVYEVPLIVAKSGINDVLTQFTGNTLKPELSSWREIVNRQKNDKAPVVRVGLVAKYMHNDDTYISVIEALKAAAWSQKCQLDLVWLNAETIKGSDLSRVDGLLVPGGFGVRGVDGKITAADYALSKNIPYLGICLGLQVAVIAAARRSGLIDANSAEFDKNTTNPVVAIMKDQVGKEVTGGTLRLGDYKARLEPSSLSAKIYGSTEITERHRHHYEVNNEYRKEIEAGGLRIVGESPDGSLVEMVEASNCDYFVATQAHPEFRSRPHRPHPLFVGLIKAILDKK